MTRKAPANVAASARARLLKVSKARQEAFTLTLMNYGAERFLYRLVNSTHHDHFVLKGAMLFAVREIATTKVDDDWHTRPRPSLPKSWKPGQSRSVE
jgi:hypothetical protein